MAKDRTAKKKTVEVKDAVLVIVIRAELPLTGDDNETDGEALDQALDALRGVGAAQVVDRKIIGTYVGEAKRTL